MVGHRALARAHLFHRPEVFCCNLPQFGPRIPCDALPERAVAGADTTATWSAASSNSVQAVRAHSAPNSPCQRVPGTF
jgi:hypothetical protein